MIEPLIGKPYDFVLEVNRSELFRLLSFLDSKLPDYAEVHSMILSAVSTTNSSHCLCFGRFPDHSSTSYLTMTGVKPERRAGRILPRNTDLQVTIPLTIQLSNSCQKRWILTAWSVEFALATEYKGLENINWKTDVIIVSYANHIIESE